MCEQVNINVSETNETINIVSSEIQEVIDINVFETTEDVTLNITEQLIQVNINKVTSAEITNTSQLINDGEDGVNPFITAADLPSLTGYVPYTGATQDVDLGEFEIKAGQVEFDQTPTGTAGVGVMRWNDSDGTVDLGLKGGNVTLQIGQESVLRVVNKTATNINLLEANYQAVRVTGAQGQRLKVDLALATTDPLSAETLGLVTETINNNQEGFITTSGLVRGINTTGSLQGETWADGDILYLSPTTAGRATKVKPVAPNHLIILGYVIHAHITQGSIFVKVDNGYELDELHNVKITSAANNNVLAYTSATDIWENKTVETALGYTPFQLPALTSGSVLFSNGTTIAQDNSNLFWDDTNNRLGIGTATPTTALDVVGVDARINTIRIGLGGGNVVDNIAVGTSALNINTSGSGNTAISYFALAANITGSNNTAVGSYALRNNTQSNNTAIGYTSLFNLSTGTLNTALGRQAARYIADGSTSLTIANQSIFIGADTKALADSQTNQIVIGYNAIGLGSNSVVLGNDSITKTALKGNVLINTTTDAGFKLDVNGTARFSDALNFTNSSSLTPQGTTAADKRILIRGGEGGAVGSTSLITLTTNANITSTSGNPVLVNISRDFVPTSGTATYTLASITGVINQTGGANGITRSLYINPTLTAAADFRAIENSVGKVCLNTTSGNTMIGTSTDAGFKLDVNGTARVQNQLTTTGSITAASTIARGVYMNQTLVAAANSDILVGLDIQSAFTNGAFTGVTNYLLRAGAGIAANSSGVIFWGNNLSSSNRGFLSWDTNRAIVTSGTASTALDLAVNLTTALKLFTSRNVMIQNGGTFTEEASSQLTVNSTTRGFLPPRMTTTEKNAIATPASGLVVYDTTLGKLCVRTASAWETITSI